MNEQAFNEYCAEVMQYKTSDLDLHFDGDYHPYYDLNQLAEVVEKLWKNHPITQLDKLDASIYNDGIKQAFRDFVWSTKC